MNVNRRRRLLLLLVVVVATLAVAASPATAAPRAADRAFTHGFVYTVDRAHPVAQAVAVRDGRIVYVGSNAGVRAYIGSHTRVVDLHGRMLMPSFTDAHAHVSLSVSFLYAVSLYDTTSLQDCLTVVQTFAVENPTMQSIRGNGWSEAMFPGIGPLKTDLDSVVSDRPVALWADSLHSIWANSKALEIAGITGNTPDPPGGVIERLPGTVGQPGTPYGEPSGTLREEPATSMVLDAIPDFTVDQYADGIRWFEQMIAAPLGITAANDPYLRPGTNAITAYEQLRKAGQLSLRIRGSLALVPWKPIGPQIRAAIAERAKHRSQLFQTNTVKLFTDGVIEGHTGLLLQDYTDRPGYRGYLFWQPAEFDAAMQAADAAKFQIHVHAVGDGAVNEALDAIAYAEAVNGPRDRRPAITHLQLAAPNDIKRVGHLGVTALPQPYWFLKDDYYHDLQVPFLGQTRADLEYPMKSFFAAGANVASSSDFPVTSNPDPLQGIQTGVMRWYPTSQMGSTIPPGDVLWPAERVSVKQMIRSFTINGAYANFLTKTTGSLKVGMSADMVVLKRNILTCAPDKIGEGNKVLLTVFRGKTIFKDASF